MMPNPNHCVFVCVAYGDSGHSQLSQIRKRLLTVDGISIVSGPVKVSDPLFESLCQETQKQLPEVK